MSIFSSLDSFALTELFRIISEEKKSGRLIVHLQLNQKESHLKPIYYVWFENGYLVAISDRLNCRSLIAFIEKRGWLSTVVTNQLRTLCPPEITMGVYLYQNNLLSKEQLSLVFQTQLHQVYELFAVQAGSLCFDDLSELKTRLVSNPWLEMTGHRMSASRVSLYALRLIKDWTQFQEQLPESNFALQRLKTETDLKLIPLESEVWQLATGDQTLSKIAERLETSIDEIKIVAFRLILLGLVDEILAEDS